MDAKQEDALTMVGRSITHALVYIGALVRADGRLESVAAWKCITDAMEARPSTTEQPTENEALREFARWVLDQASEGDDIVGGDVQDRALELGLLTEITVAAPCGDTCICAEAGVFPTNCDRYADVISGATENG